MAVTRLQHKLAVVMAILVVLVAAALISSSPVAATDDTAAAPNKPVAPLAARLHRAFSVTLNDGTGDQDGGGGIMECWGALAQLSSCTSEILLFLINGESYIGPECCRAVRGATRHCWPAMLASVGFTAEQADVLRGFCEGEAAAQHGPPPVAGNGAPPPGS